MLRDTSIVYDLCTQLKEYRYINHYSDEILTKSQEERINDYVDDLSIDLFFRLAPFKPILITKNDISKRFTPCPEISQNSTCGPLFPYAS